MDYDSENGMIEVPLLYVAEPGAHLLMSILFIAVHSLIAYNYTGIEALLDDILGS